MCRFVQGLNVLVQPCLGTDLLGSDWVCSRYMDDVTVHHVAVAVLSQTWIGFSFPTYSAAVIIIDALDNTVVGHVVYRDRAHQLRACVGSKRFEKTEFWHISFLDRI